MSSRDVIVEIRAESRWPRPHALVTGSAGFVGRHMAAELETRGWRVTRMDVAVGPGGDCLNLFRLGRVGPVPQYDLVVHAAARAPHRAAIDGQPAAHIYNQMLDAAMFEWAVRTGQGRVLYLSSCAVLDQPEPDRTTLGQVPAPPVGGPDDYGLLKLTGERMAGQARAAGLPVTVVRPYSGYGEDQGPDWPFGAFLERARRRANPFEIWGGGNQMRDWIHVDDLVAGALAVAESGTEDPISLCTGAGWSMLGLARLMCAEAGYEPTFEFLRDKPAGADWRVGDPRPMLRYYTPRMSLEEGVKRALAAG